MMYPGEYHVTPLDDQQLQEAARQRRLRLARKMMGPEEVEHAGRRLIKPIPGWAMFCFGFGAALTALGLLYVAHALAGINGVIAFMVCWLLIGVAFSLPMAAAKD